MGTLPGCVRGHATGYAVKTIMACRSACWEGRGVLFLSHQQDERTNPEHLHVHGRQVF